MERGDTPSRLCEEPGGSSPNIVARGLVGMVSSRARSLGYGAKEEGSKLKEEKRMGSMVSLGDWFLINRWEVKKCFRHSIGVPNGTGGREGRRKGG